MALHANLRLAISASLIALGGIAATVALSLLLPFGSEISEKQVVAQSDPPGAETPCAEQSWWRLGRNCLSRHDLPWTSARTEPNPGTFEPVRPAEAPPPQLTESQRVPAPPAAAPPPAPQETPVAAKPAPPDAAVPSATPPAQASNVAPEAEPPQPSTVTQPAPAAQPSRTAQSEPPPQPMSPANAAQPSTAAPVAAEQRTTSPAVDKPAVDARTTAARRWRTARRPAARPRPAVTTASEDEEREAAPKEKTFRRERVAKTSTKTSTKTPAKTPAKTATKTATKTPTRTAAKSSSRVVAEDEADDSPKTAPKRTHNSSSRNALNAVRRFGDSLPDVPIDAYSGDGTRRKVIIRPTSIQDYYYYSAPR